MKILSNLNSLDNIQDGTTRKLITKTSTQGGGEVLTDLTISGDTLILNKSDISSLTSELLSTIYPIGSVIIREDSGDYSNWLGFNWDRAARGRFILGYDEKDSDTVNNRTENVGGEKTHTLTVSEMPAHNHVEQYVGVSWLQPGSSGDWCISSALEPFRYTGNTGGGQAHNNMPPYVTLAYWKRIPADWTYTCTVTVESSSDEVRICTDYLNKDTIIALSAGETRTIKVPSIIYLAGQRSSRMIATSNETGCTSDALQDQVTMTSNTVSFTVKAWIDGPEK